MTGPSRRRGPTALTANTRLRLYEPVPLKARRAALHRAIEERCGVSAGAAMLLVDLATWDVVAVDASYEAALEELRRRGLAERLVPLAQDPDQRPRGRPTPFVADVMEHIGALTLLDDEQRALEPAAPRKGRP